MNETLNSTIAATPNETFTSLIEAFFGQSIAESYLVVLACAFIFIILFMLISMVLPKMRLGVRVIAAYSPILALDLTTDFGQYLVNLPFSEPITLTRLYLTLSLIDGIFSFAIFEPALNVIESYSSYGEITVTTTVLALIVIYCVFDMIYEFILFYLGFHAMTTLIENKFNFQIPWQKLTSVILAATPILAYNFAFKNPLHEIETATSYFQAIALFLTYSSPAEKLFVFSMGFLSIFIIFVIILIIVQYGLSAYITTTGNQIDTFYSFSALAMKLAFMYSIIYAVHTTYAWYYIFFMLALWKGFTWLIDNGISEAKKENAETRKEDNLVDRIMAGVDARIIANANGVPVSSVQHAKRTRPSRTQMVEKPSIISIYAPLIIAVIALGGAILMLFPNIL